MMNLIAKIVSIRRLGDQKAVDLLWRAADGSVLRDDGATEIPDQVNVHIYADDEAVKRAINQKRDDLYRALDCAGVGITIVADMLPNDALIGQEF